MKSDKKIIKCKGLNTLKFFSGQDSLVFFEAGIFSIVIVRKFSIFNSFERFRTENEEKLFSCSENRDILKKIWQLH